MAGNLPDDVTPSDIDNAYGRPDPNPEPEGYCPHCREPYGYHNTEHREIELSHDGLRSVDHRLCLSCGEVVEAHLKDLVDAYLESWRTMPETMERTINAYSELREIGGEQ